MPPAYDIAAKLPTYEEAEMTKHSDSRVSQMFSTFYTSIHTNKIKSQPLVPLTRYRITSHIRFSTPIQYKIWFLLHNTRINVQLIYIQSMSIMLQWLQVD
jgi:hypothetical protein